jgi:hypothetical protein
MNGRLEEILAARLSELEATTWAPDWGDVRRRARRRRTRRNVAKLCSAGAVGLAAIIAATPALGLRGQIVQFFGGGEPAPPPVVKSFGQIDVAAPDGMATGVLSHQTRDVLEVPLSTGKMAVVWVAPTRSGGFCRFTSTEGRDSMGGGGCDRDRALQFAPGLSIPGPISPEGEIEAPPVIFDGDTLIHGASRVEIRFEDGDSATVPVTWVSEPIDAGFFVYEVPQTHWGARHRPVSLVLEDQNGHVLASNSEITRALGQAARVMGHVGSSGARSSRH